jgi:hypothetical protein
MTPPLLYSWPLWIAQRLVPSWLHAATWCQDQPWPWMRLGQFQHPSTTTTTDPVYKYMANWLMNHKIEIIPSANCCWYSESHCVSCWLWPDLRPMPPSAAVVTVVAVPLLQKLILHFGLPWWWSILQALLMQGNPVTGLVIFGPLDGLTDRFDRSDGLEWVQDRLDEPVVPFPTTI